MGDRERSHYYNYSTFNNLIITDLVGLRPRFDDKIGVNPLIPVDKWEYFCLGNVSYHGRNITITWDKYGGRYHYGSGLTISVDGRPASRSEKLERLVCRMN